MTTTRATARRVHLDRVDAAARYLCDELDVPFDDAESDKQDAWRWRAEQALVAADHAAGRTKSRT